MFHLLDSQIQNASPTFSTSALETHTGSNPERVLGQAFNPFTGAVIDFQAVTPDAQPCALSVGEAFVEYAFSSRELKSKLRIDVSAEGSYGAGSAKARASYVRETENFSRSAYIIIAARQEVSGAKSTVNALSGAFIQSAGNGVSENEMFSRFGCAFITRAIFGGELFLVIRSEFSSLWDFERFQGSLKGSYGTGKLDVSVLREESFRQVIQAGECRLFISGVRPRNYPFLRTDNDGKQRVQSVDSAMNFANRFNTYVDQDDREILLSVNSEPYYRTQNWDERFNRLDPSDALIEIKAAESARDECIRLAKDWEQVGRNPGFFMIDSGSAALRRARQKASRLRGLYVRISDWISRKNEDPFSRRQFRHPDLDRLADLPSRKPVSVPTLVTRCYQIKRDPASGHGRAPDRRRTFKVNVENLGDNWFPNHSGGRLELTQMSVVMRPAPVDLSLSYAVKGVSGRPVTGADGQNVNLPNEARFQAVSFELAGDMAEAYYIEYQGHAGNKSGDTAVAGNTGRAVAPAGTFVEGSWRLEGIRLAIFPKTLE